MSKQSPKAVEQEFFTSLIEADAGRLGELLADDFLLIDVMTGCAKDADYSSISGGITTRTYLCR